MDRAFVARRQIPDPHRLGNLKTIKTTKMKNTRFGGIGLIVQLICLLCTQAFGATTFEQTRNGGIGDPPINPADWVNGNAGASNSHYVEGESIGYRLVLTGLSTGSHTAEIEWDIRSDSKNAIDYITHYQRINELVNPLRDLPGSFGPPNTFPIPPPPSSKLVGGIPQPTTSFNALPAAERLFTIYNGSITKLEYINNADGNLATGAAATRPVTSMDPPTIAA
jgi:hypothetical protein